VDEWAAADSEPFSSGSRSTCSTVWAVPRAVTANQPVRSRRLAEAPHAGTEHEKLAPSAIAMRVR